MECSICLEKTPDKKLIACGHVFHKECINKWLDEVKSKASIQIED